MKLKDKTAADIVASWYRERSPLPAPLAGRLASRPAMLALDGPDLPEEILEWQEAAKALRWAFVGLRWADPERIRSARDRLHEAEMVLVGACEQGVTT